MQESIEGYEDKGEPFLSSRYVGISRFPWRKHVSTSFFYIKVNNCKGEGPQIVSLATQYANRIIGWASFQNIQDHTNVWQCNGSAKNLCFYKIE